MWRNRLEAFYLRKVHLIEKAMCSDIIRTVHKIAVALGQVVLSKVANKAFSIAWEVFREGNLLPKCHLENLICILVHKRRSPHE